jgi:hypothetical protein
VLAQSGELSKRGVDMGDTRMLEAIGKEIAKEMKSDFTHRARKLVGHLDLPPETPVSQVLERCHGRLVENIQTAVREHFEAIEKISADKALNDDQRLMLLTLAQTRRLDPVQVAQLKRLGAELGKSIRIMGDAATRGRPVALFERLAILNDAFDAACQEIGKHAETMWLSRTLEDPVARERLFGLGLDLAIAGSYPDVDAACLALQALTASGDEETDDGSSSTPKLTPLATVQQVMRACDGAASTQIGRMKDRYAAIVIALALRAGIDLDEVVERRNVPMRKGSDNLVEIEVTRGEALIARIAGDGQPLSALPIEILSRSLLDVPRGDEAAVQDNGVFVGGRAEEVVAPELDAMQLFGQLSPAYVTHEIAETAHGPLASAFVEAIGELDIVIDHVPLTGTPEERIKAFFDRTAVTGDENKDRRLALEISRHMNPVTMRHWASDLQHAALAGQGASLAGGPPPRVAFDFNSHEEGYWWLEGSVVSAPETLTVRGEAEPVPLKGGVIVSRVSRMVPPFSIEEGKPMLMQDKALVTFAF